MNYDYNNNMQLSRTEGDLFTPYERRRGLPIGNLTSHLQGARPTLLPQPVALPVIVSTWLWCSSRSRIEVVSVVGQLEGFIKVYSGFESCPRGLRPPCRRAAATGGAAPVVVAGGPAPAEAFRA